MPKKLDQKTLEQIYERRTPDSHKQEITDDFTLDSQKKYELGQKEHGGKLWRKPTIHFMGEEILDQWAYYHVLREQWARVEHLLGAEIQRLNKACTPIPDNLQAACNIMKTGNEAGQELAD